MKAVPIDGEIYLVMDKFEAQVVAAACSLAGFDWRKGDDYAKKMANIANRAENELILAVFNQRGK